MPESARLAQIRGLLADDPTDPMLRYMLGMEYASIGDDAAAADTFEKLAADAAYVPAFHMGGQALIRLNRPDAAAKLLKAGVAAAEATGDLHAAGEMQGLLGTVE